MRRDGRGELRSPAFADEVGADRWGSEAARAVMNDSPVDRGGLSVVLAVSFVCHPSRMAKPFSVAGR